MFSIKEIKSNRATFVPIKGTKLYTCNGRGIYSVSITSERNSAGYRQIFVNANALR